MHPRSIQGRLKFDCPSRLWRKLSTRRQMFLIHQRPELHWNRPFSLYLIKVVISTNTSDQLNPEWSAWVRLGLYWVRIKAWSTFLLWAKELWGTWSFIAKNTKCCLFSFNSTSTVCHEYAPEHKCGLLPCWNQCPTNARFPPSGATSKVYNKVNAFNRNQKKDTK